ncbi:MAG: hypothetical protein RJA38_924 [Bacteroidota bacterium]|jgi:hypothetical protein
MLRCNESLRGMLRECLADEGLTTKFQQRSYNNVVPSTAEINSFLPIPIAAAC